MKTTVCYIKRKKLPGYNSIEELFENIISEIDKHMLNSTFELENSGGSPLTIVKNIMNFKKKFGIYHITGDAHYMALATGKKSVLTIHDVNSIVNGSYLKKVYMKLFWFWLPAFFVKRITVISEFTKKELEKIVPFAKDKIRVVPNPINAEFYFSYYFFNQPKPKILLLGTKSNKNLERVLEALKDICCEVVLIGKLTKEQDFFLKTLNIDLTAKFNLTLDEVVAEYRASDLVCFASTYEGFGMPIIEAQAVGRPVVTSNIGAMKEVAANSALLVDPYDIASIKEGIIKVIEDVKLRESLIEKGLRNVERFSVEAVAKDYMEIYREIRTGNGLKNKR